METFKGTVIHNIKVPFISFMMVYVIDLLVDDLVRVSCSWYIVFFISKEFEIKTNSFVDVEPCTIFILRV